MENLEEKNGPHLFTELWLAMLPYCMAVTVFSIPCSAPYPPVNAVKF